MRRVLAVGLAVLASIAMQACHRRGRGTVAQPIPRSLARIAQYAQRDLGCDHVDQVLYVLPTVVQARGCGQRQEYLALPGRLPAGIGHVETTAARQMQCEVGHLSVESPAPSVRAVTGCERRARYDLSCTRYLCAWTMTAHAGRWAGLVTSGPDVPAQFQSWWELPPEVTAPAVSSGAGDGDLETVTLPPPPP
jgi:hypothetical protein